MHERVRARRPSAAMIVAVIATDRRAQRLRGRGQRRRVRQDEGAERQEHQEEVDRRQQAAQQHRHGHAGERVEARQGPVRDEGGQRRRNGGQRRRTRRTRRMRPTPRTADSRDATALRRAAMRRSATTAPSRRRSVQCIARRRHGRGQPGRYCFDSPLQRRKLCRCSAVRYRRLATTTSLSAASVGVVDAALRRVCPAQESAPSTSSTAHVGCSTTANGDVLRPRAF